jgi:hypothetical protein
VAVDNQTATGSLATFADNSWRLARFPAVSAPQAAELRGALRLATVHGRSRQGLHRVTPLVALTVTSHGKQTGWLRDPVITALHFEAPAQVTT